VIGRGHSRERRRALRECEESQFAVAATSRRASRFSSGEKRLVEMRSR